MASLERVGIAEHAGQRASTLSGGQQQRGAIARAMVQGAKVILADEPIASLDPESSHRVLAALATLNREDGATVLVSLHQIDYAWRYCPRSVALKDGRVVFDGPTHELDAGAAQARLRQLRELARRRRKRGTGDSRAPGASRVSRHAPRCAADLRPPRRPGARGLLELTRGATTTTEQARRLMDMRSFRFIAPLLGIALLAASTAGAP